MQTQDQINDFYHTNWKSNFHKFRNSGFNLVDEINQLNPNLVIDAGCGENPLKGKIKNLVGFDPVHEQADFISTIESAPFSDACADVVLALGSVNFGSRNNVLGQLAILKSWVRHGGRIYMRGCPGDGYDNDGIEWFKWSVKDIESFADILDLEILSDIKIDYFEVAGRKMPHRYVWVYGRK